MLVDRPGSVQADIRIGRVAVTRADPDYFPLLVANAILGGGTASRIFANIREKQGFAYDAHSATSALKDSGTFSVVTQVRNEVLGPAIDAVFGEMTHDRHQRCLPRGTRHRKELPERHFRDAHRDAGWPREPDRRDKDARPAAHLFGAVYDPRTIGRARRPARRGGQVHRTRPQPRWWWWAMPRRSRLRSRRSARCRW